MNQCPHCEEAIPPDALKCYSCGNMLTHLTRKRRSPIVAFFLSIIMPGLGQMYNAQLLKGVIYHFLGYLLLLFSSFSVICDSFQGMIIFLCGTILYYVFIFSDAIYIAIKIKFIDLKKYNKWYAYGLMLILGVSISYAYDDLIENRVLGIKAYNIPAGSMIPSLLIGDHIIVDLRNNTAPQKGDVIVFNFPDDTSKESVERVVGIGGDKIKIKNKKLYVNNILLKEPYIIHRDTRIEKSRRDNYGPFIVPQDSFFVLGDNRDQSYDSRFWGVIKQAHIKGKALYIYFSLDEEKFKIRWNRIGKTIK